MPLSVAGMVDAIDKGTAKIICVEAAGLMEYSASVLGSGGVSSRGVGWTETRKQQTHKDRRRQNPGAPAMPGAFMEVKYITLFPTMQVLPTNRKVIT